MQKLQPYGDACKNLRTYQLNDCEIYTSCEPCPMCLGAIYWAGPKIIYFANNREDAAAIGFDNNMIYEEMIAGIPFKKIPIISLSRQEALKIFNQWHQKMVKQAY